MPWRTRITRVTHTYAHILELQLFLTIIAMLIVFRWGLAYSCMSIVGNIIFAPFLTVFLVLSALLFFTELVHVPNAAIAWCLSYWSALWHHLLNYSSRAWMIGCTQPPPWLCLLIVLCTVSIMHYRKSTSTQRLVALSAMLCVIVVSSWMTRPAQALFTVACGKETVTVIRHNNQTTVIDTGALVHNTNPTTWCTYTLQNRLNTLLGTATIDRLILLRPSKRVFDAANTLCHLNAVRALYCTAWHGALPDEGINTSYQALLHHTAQNNTPYTLITTVASIALGQDMHLVLQPQRHVFKRGRVRYPAMTITSNKHIDSRTINLSTVPRTCV